MREQIVPVERLEDRPYFASLKCRKNKPFKKMINQTYSDIVTPELLAGAIENNEYQGFREDYHLLHCLIRKYKPTSFMEIGTNMGTGTNIICNAGKEWLMQVYSLDLPTELAHVSLQHPISEGKGDRVGSNCKFHYTQLRGDSMTFKFADIPCEGYYCDGEHDTQHAEYETIEMLLCEPSLIVWHDTDLREVVQGILNAFDFVKPNMELIRVTDTRISYAIKK